jgi:hypothetical protein
MSVPTTSISTQSNRMAHTDGHSADDLFDTTAAIGSDGVAYVASHTTVYSVSVVQRCRDPVSRHRSLPLTAPYM